MTADRRLFKSRIHTSLVSTRLKALRNYLAPLLFVVCAALSPFYSWAVTGMLPVLVLLVLAVSLVAERLENKELSAAFASLKESTDGLLEKIGSSYNNARLVNEVGRAISKQCGMEEVLESIKKALAGSLGYDRCLILLADMKKSSLKFRTGFGYSDAQCAALKQTSWNLEDPESTNAIVACFKEQRPLWGKDASELFPPDSAPSNSLADTSGGQGFICCAIVCEGESVGVLAVDNTTSRKKLLQSDMSLLLEVAPVIGMSIRNAMYIGREKRMAEQMRHSQKMEAVGQLARGIAHDFNNLITAIIGYASLAQMNMDQDDPALRYLQQILLAADRATQLTQGLVAFSRKQVNDPQPVELNGMVANIQDLLRRLITAEIELKLSLSEELLSVRADSSQLDQVLMNLVTNARDAMNGTGVLTVRTAPVELCDDFVKRHGFGAVGPYALLSVSDTGSGMDGATKAHVLEPFFTTKEVGKGTGLGLAIVYGIVKQHEGYLDIESKPGAGTTFNIYLPLLQKEATAPTPTPGLIFQQ